MFEPMTSEDWAVWLRNASDDELKGQAHTWSKTRTGQDAQDELDRREREGCECESCGCVVDAEVAELESGECPSCAADSYGEYVDDMLNERYRLEMWSAQ
jgi:hypothetical protein